VIAQYERRVLGLIDAHAIMEGGDGFHCITKPQAAALV
jgi:agmatine/peptidylarginine deiminase